MSRTWLVCGALLLAVAVCSATIEPVSVVPIGDGELVLLEEQASTRGFDCAKGMKCPIVDGSCCPGGKMCCPDRCVRKNNTKFVCKPSDAREAEKKLYEVFMRKRMLDRQEDQLAKEQQAHEKKMVDAAARTKAKKVFSANLHAKKREIATGIEKNKVKVMEKLKKLAKQTGTSISKIVPKNVAVKLGIKTKSASKTSKPASKTKAKKSSKTKQSTTKGKKAVKKDPKKKQKGGAKKKQKKKNKKKSKSPEQQKNDFKNEKDQYEKATRLAPVKGWSNKGSFYDVLRIQQWRHFCFLSGSLKGNNELVARVPKYCRPLGGRLIFQVLRDGKPARLDVLKDGRVLLVTSKTSKQRDDKNILTVSGVAWDVHNGTEMFLTRSWANYGQQYRDAFLSKVGDMCVATGVVQGGKWGKIGEVSEECDPEKQLILAGNNLELPVRLDVYPNGSFGTPIGYVPKHKWISLSNMIYPRRPGRELHLLNKWSNDKIAAPGSSITPNSVGETKYRHAEYTRVGNIVMLSGLVRVGVGGHIATLPPNYRPFDRLVFGTTHLTGLTQVDVTKEGHIIYVSGRVKNFVVLDGISFYAVREDIEDEEQEDAQYDEEERQRDGLPEEHHDHLSGLGPDPMEKSSHRETNQVFGKSEQIQALEKKLADMAKKLPAGHKLHKTSKTKPPKIQTKK